VDDTRVGGNCNRGGKGGEEEASFEIMNSVFDIDTLTLIPTVFRLP
jgi:hypothetical protein